MGDLLILLFLNFEFEFTILFSEFVFLSWKRNWTGWISLEGFFANFSPLLPSSSWTPLHFHPFLPLLLRTDPLLLYKDKI